MVVVLLVVVVVVVVVVVLMVVVEVLGGGARNLPGVWRFIEFSGQNGLAWYCLRAWNSID